MYVCTCNYYFIMMSTVYSSYTIILSPTVGEGFVQQIVNDTINAEVTEQFFPVVLISNNDIVECNKIFNLTLSTQEACKTTTKDNSTAQLINDDGKELNAFGYSSRLHNMINFSGCSEPADARQSHGIDWYVLN